MDLSWDIPLARASAKRKTPDSKRTAALRKRPASSTPCATLIRPATHGSEHTQLESIVRSPPLPPIFIPLPKVRRIGSMCAGMLSEHWALTGEFVHTFAVEIAPFARRFAHANAHIERMFSDVSADEFLKNIPDHDVLSAGFPCQSFSTAGRGRGRADPRGSIYKHVLHVVARKMPRIVIMENVKGLVERHSEVLLDITETLKSLVDPLTGKQCYKVFVKVLNSADFRLPQRRERVYIVAVKLCGRAVDTVTLRWPTPSPRVGLSMVWDSDAVPLNSYTYYPMPSTNTGRKRIKEMLKLVREWSSAEKASPESIPVVVDIGSSFLVYGRDISPCLTRSRCSNRGYWSLQHGRPLTVSELARLQGFDVKKMKISVSEGQMGAMLGNSFSAPVWRGVFNAAVAAAEGS